MRVAIVSDVHGNRRAFEAVLADLRRAAPDLILHGGDLAYGGAHPAEIIDQVRSLGWAGVRGNTDEMLWAPKSLTEFAATAPKIAPLLARIKEIIPPTLASIGEERLRWLEELAYEYSGEGFCLLHASPGDLWRAPMANASDEELQSTYASLGARIVVYGHIHCSYVRRLSASGIRRRERGKGRVAFGAAACGVAGADSAGRKICSGGVERMDLGGFLFFSAGLDV